MCQLQHAVADPVPGTSGPPGSGMVTSANLHNSHHWMDSRGICGHELPDKSVLKDTQFYQILSKLVTKVAIAPEKSIKFIKTQPTNFHKLYIRVYMINL